jgi:hypothetical protein
MKHYYAFVDKSNLVQELIVSEVELTQKVETGVWHDVTMLRPLPQRGWKYYPDNNTFRPQTEQAIILETARTEARREIDQAAAHARARYITTIAGQQEVYREKFDEAIDYLTNNDDSKYPDEDYPLLLVETAIRDIDMRSIAEEIVLAKKRWVKKMAAIEELRLGGKYGLEQCETLTEINRLKGNHIHKLNLI